MEYTCGNCQHLESTAVLPGQLPFQSCKLTEHVIPHVGEAKDDGSFEIRYTRIPTSCPREDDDFVKSDKPAPHKHHVIRTLR